MKQQQHDINFEEDSEKKIRVPDGKKNLSFKISF